MKKGSISLKEMCEKKGLNYYAVYQRIQTGWTLKQALAKPINKQKPHKIHGKKISLKEYCKKNKINFSKASNRFYGQKMSLEDAVDFSKGRSRTRFKLNGKIISLKAEAQKRGLSPSAVYQRVRRGCSIKKALDFK